MPEDNTNLITKLQQDLADLTDQVTQIAYSMYKKLGPDSNTIQGSKLQSTNFVKGSAGWELTPDGNLEANAGVFRGALSANSLDIPDTVTANSMHVNTAGDTWWGATTLASALASITKAGLLRAVSATTLNIKSYTCFETAGRFTNTVGGTGANTFGTSGLDQPTGATATSFAMSQWFVTQQVFANSPTYSAVLNMANLAAASGGGSYFCGLGFPAHDGSGITLSNDNFCGFFIQKATPVVNLYAVQNNGNATYTTSGILTTLADNDVLDLILKKNADASVDYYWRKNGGTLSAATNLATKVPAAATANNKAQFSISNVGSAFNFEIITISASYER